MQYQVLKEIEAKTVSGTRIIKAGQIINIPPEKAEKFVSEGKLAPLKMPYFESDGDLVIPFDSDQKYHWWAGGQSISETIKELKGNG